MERVIWYRFRKAVARGPGICAVGGSGRGLGNCLSSLVGSAGIGPADGIAYMVKGEAGCGSCVLDYVYFGKVAVAGRDFSARLQLTPEASSLA